MKTTKFIFPLIISVLLIVQGCRKANLWGITGHGSNVSETRTVGDFDRIELHMDADLLYSQDSVYYLEVNGQKNIIDVLDTKVNGSTLEVDFRKNVWKHKRVTVTVHSPRINSLAVSGSGDIKVQNNLSSSSVNLKVSGSGNISIPSLIAQTLDAHISGSGNVQVYGGSLNNFNVSVSGSGNIDALNCQASAVIAKVSGSGNISVNVLESLNVTISGSGNIKYKGLPAVNSSISGSGSLIHL